MRIKVECAASCDDESMVVAHPSPSVEAPQPQSDLRLATLLPREHGSWALALEPLALAMIAAPSWRGVALALAAVALFLMRRPWHVASVPGNRARHAQAVRVLAGLAIVAAVLGATAIAPDPGRLALPLVIAVAGASVFAWFDRQREARVATAECAGAMAFAALASAIVLMSPDRGGVVLAVGVGAFALVRDWTSILPLRVYVRRRKGQAASGVIAMVFAGASSVGAIVAAKPLGTWVPAAWSLVFAARTAWLVGPWAPAWPARRIGWMEMALGLVAVVTTGISFQ
jgi:hypothetical protein